MGLSFKDLAELSDTSVSTVNRLINEDDYWPKGTLQLRAIMQVLGLDPDAEVPVVVDGVAQISVDDALDGLTRSEQQEAIRHARAALLATAAQLRARRGTFRPAYA